MLTMAGKKWARIEIKEFLLARSIQGDRLFCTYFEKEKLGKSNNARIVPIKKNGAKGSPRDINAFARSSTAGSSG